MSHTTAFRPQPTEAPRPLPSGLIAGKLALAPLLLCLDYDGTLAEIVSDPFRAFPLKRAKAALTELARYRDHITIAIVTGRDLETLWELLGLRDGLLFAGTHGLELVGRDGLLRHARGVIESLADFDRLRAFLVRTVPANHGFIMEDKGVGLTVNYRNADPDEAREILSRFEQFVTAEAPALRLLDGKMVREALPAASCGKGEAIEFFINDLGASPANTVYLGDDATDEDAFQTLRSDGGITVMVGPGRLSHAEYRVEQPQDVVAILEQLVSALARRP